MTEHDLIADVLRLVDEGVLQDRSEKPLRPTVTVVGGQETEREGDGTQFVRELAEKYPYARLVVTDKSPIERWIAEAAEMLDVDCEVLVHTPAKKPKRIYAVLWTWKKHRIVKTKQKGQKALRTWMLWHERHGWKIVYGSMDVGYLAVRGREKRVVAFHTYDAKTKRKIEPWETTTNPSVETRCVTAASHIVCFDDSPRSQGYMSLAEKQNKHHSVI